MLDETTICKIVREASRESVHETLTALGFDIHDPHEVQSDLLYLRRIRKGSEFVSQRVKASIITVLIPTFLYLLWEAIKRGIKD